MAKQQSEKVVKYRRPVYFNLGAIIFGVIFIYIIIILYYYATSKHIAGYEVKSGSLAVNNLYRGVVIRQEKTFTAKESGYISYYAREGEKIPNGGMIYTIDESGKLGDMLREGYETDDNLTNADMSELKTEIINYRNTYNDKKFDTVYDFKYNIEGTVNKLANRNVLSSLSQIKDNSVLDLVDFDYSEDSGIVVYNYDGLENLKTQEINEDTFIEENHPKTQLTSNSLIGSGDIAYKLITDENWSIVIPVDENRFEELEDGDYVKVKFIKTGDVSWGKITLFTSAENPSLHYCMLSFTNSMISYATDRYLDIELLLTPQKGLKVPNSAIVKKEFYLIPKEYMVEDSNGGDSNSQGFMRETYLEDGTLSTEFVSSQIYYSTEEDYYVDTASFRLGDYIIPPDGSDKFAVGKKDSLIGVYNMNKGYADFTQITILYQNKEYSIVKSNTDYGLSVYDHIVLDGSSVTDNDFVFEQ